MRVINYLQLLCKIECHIVGGNICAGQKANFTGLVLESATSLLLSRRRHAGIPLIVCG